MPKASRRTTGGAAGRVTVGIDIGTTSVKAVAADESGTVLARTRVRHRVESPEPGYLQHDVTKAWRHNVRRAWRAVREGHDVAGVQVSAMVPSLGAVNRRGVGVAPGLLYGDTRGGADSGRNPAESGELLGFLRWLAAEAPDAHGYWPAQAVANHALCGVGAIDTTTAMTAVPLFDYSGWDTALAEAAGARVEQLPAISPGAAAIGEIEGAPVGGGTIDALGEQWVAGADEAGDVLVICGATLITWAAIPEWREAPGLWTVPHTAAGLSLIGGPSSAGGVFIDWVDRLLGGSREVAGDPGRVPVWAPYPRGERTPLHDPGRRAQLVDLDLTHGPAEIRRAAYEATGFVVRHHLDLAGVTARRIVATGGGARSDLWMQCLADATGAPVDVVATSEGAALGAAFLARVTAGLEAAAEDGARWARYARRVEPDANWVEPMAARYRRFRELTGPPRV
jgi:xylulokinase